MKEISQVCHGIILQHILADCVGTTSILIIGPMFVGSISAKLSTLNSFSLAIFKKLSFRLRSAGESESTSKTLIKNYTASKKYK